MSRHRSYINLGLSACLGVSLSAIAADGPTVHVYNWYDYIGPTTLQDFKRDTGIQPVYDTFDSAEVLEGKLLTSRSGYDVVVASNFSLPTLIKAGALAPLPRNQMPDFQNMDTELLAKLANNDPGNQYAVPYLRSPVLPQRQPQRDPTGGRSDPQQPGGVSVGRRHGHVVHPPAPAPRYRASADADLEQGQKRSVSVAFRRSQACRRRRPRGRFRRQAWLLEVLFSKPIFSATPLRREHP